MKTRLLYLSCLLASLAGQLFGQAATRKLPANINHPSLNISAPFICLDGNVMLFLSDNGEDNKIVMNYTAKADGANWKDPVVLAKSINNALNYQKGFTLSPDGKTIYVTNMKGGGMGGFDMYKIEQRGSYWGDMVNLGLPFNSKGNDGSITFSADGTAAYFMRCEKMTFDKAEGCKLLMTRKKPNGQWEEAVELPAFINAGNSQMPRILGDGETLLFSSDKLSPSKGGMDLYMTRWNGTTWSSPVALSFVNTPAEDLFVSAAATGRYLLKDAPGTRKSELVEFLMPGDIRPKATMKVEGNVNVSTAYISVFNQKSQAKIYNGRPAADGKFLLYLNEGGIYDLSIEPEQDNFTFYSKEFNLVKDRIPTVEKVSATIKPVGVGDEIELAGVSFKENSIELTPGSTQELRRVVRMIKGNPASTFMVDVTLYGFRQDSIQSDADLSETTMDTLKLSGATDSLVVKRRFHNDRTGKQSAEIVAALAKQGVDTKKIAVRTKAVEALPENRKTVVKIIVK